MSAREFLPVLRDVESRLSAPILERVRILRELEFDLEELRARFMADGLPAGEAQSRAAEALVPDGWALQQLDDLHTPVYRRLTRNIHEDRLRLLERTALVLVTAAVLGFETLLLLRGGIFLIAPRHLWPVLGAGGLLFAVAVWNGFRLWIKGNHQPFPFGVRAVLGAAAVVLFAGFSSTFVDSYQLAAILERSPELAEALVLPWLLRSAALLSVSIVLALAGALSWFVMTQWLAAVSAAHRELLGVHPFDNPKGDRRHA